MKRGKTLAEVFAKADGQIGPELIRLRKSINRLKRTMSPAMESSAEDPEGEGDKMDPEYEKNEQKPQKGRFNVAGQVITHPRLKGEWVIVATQAAGGSSGEGMSGHDDYPDGHEIVLRQTMMPGSNDIDWQTKEKRFYQSGCFNDDVMLTNPKVVRDLRKSGK